MILLDVVLTNGWFTLIVIALGIILFALYSGIFAARKERDEEKRKILERELEYQKTILGYETNMNGIALTQFEKFKATELESQRKALWEQAVEAAKVQFRVWIIEEEARLRKDAVNRSMGVNLGKITEHLIPFSKQFEQFNSKDARFIGNPLDLVVFDGVADEKELYSIYFIEVKSGTSNLSARQRKLRDAIKDHRVYWKLINVGAFEWEYDEEQQKAHGEDTEI